MTGAAISELLNVAVDRLIEPARIAFGASVKSIAPSF